MTESMDRPSGLQLAESAVRQCVGTWRKEGLAAELLGHLMGIVAIDTQAEIAGSFDLLAIWMRGHESLGDLLSCIASKDWESPGRIADVED